jgi:outer membrane protein, heavy metal efflux system
MSVHILRLTAAIGTLWLCAGRVSAQSPDDSLTLAAVYARLEAGTPRVQAALASARAAEARIGPARRLPDPALQFGLMNRELPGLAYADVIGMNQIQVTQTLPIGGKLGLAADIERAKTASAQARAAEVRIEERERAAMAFFELYEADRSIALASESRGLLRDIGEIASAMYAVGGGRQVDVLRAQVELERMSQDLVRMGAMRKAAESRLNAVLDVPGETPVATPVLPAFPESLPRRDSLERLALARPMLAAGAQDVRAAQVSEQLAEREIWPDLELGVQYGWRPMAGGTDHMLSAMFGITLPIWAGSRQIAMRRETEAMRQMAESDLAAMQAETRGRIGELDADVQRAHSLLRLYRTTILPQADATAASALAAYRVGGVDFMQLLDARMGAITYRQEVIRLEAELGRTIAELEMLTATELMGPGTPTSSGGKP